MLFLNPRAGTFDDGDVAGLREAAAASELQVVEIDPAIDVRSIVRRSLDIGGRTFVVAGGDGSVHHVAQALVHTDGVLGVVPVGSVNHLARDLNIPLGDWRAAFDVAVNGTIAPIDVGRVNDRYFINSVMLGIYPTISEYRERFRSMHSRWSAYFKALRLALRHFPHVTLVLEMHGRVDTLRTQLFVVAVNEYDLSTTGIVAPKTTLSDGKLTMYSLSFMTRWGFVRAAAKYLRGRIKDVHGFKRVRLTQVRIDTGRRRLRISVDGELMDLPTPLQVMAVPSALLVRRQA